MNYPVSISFNEINIPITVRVNPRAKYLRIAVRPDQTVTVTLPKGFPYSMTERYIKQKAGWIWSKVNLFAQAATDSNYQLIPRSTKLDYVQNKEQARVLVKTKLQQFNRHYNFSYGRIAIRNQKTRWGSCSLEGNLNFNYKVVYLPEDQLDYLIVHELCHVAEFNHSPKFWQLVGETVIDYKNLRKNLRLAK